MASTHPQWALGFEDETWWSRLAQPALSTWAPAHQPLRLVEQTVPKTDPDPKALACYGLLLREQSEQGAASEQLWLRFVAGRPLSTVTSAFLSWVCAKLAGLGKTALLLVWDNASWHRSHAVRHWIREHNQQVKQEGTGIRSVRCPLPSKSPWLNPLEPHWVHGKRAVVEPERVLTATELTDRVYAYFSCPHEEPLSIPQQVS